MLTFQFDFSDQLTSSSGLQLWVIVWIICRVLDIICLWYCVVFQAPSLSQPLHQLSPPMSSMKDFGLWDRIRGQKELDSFFTVASFLPHSNITASTSKNSLRRLLTAIPMPYQCHWRSVSGTRVCSSFGLWSRGLRTAIRLPLLKPAVFTYSLLLNSQSFFGIYRQTLLLIFYDNSSNLKLLPNLF